ncbi:MAG: PepSY-associated TM helix domain-containing protein [Beijerinckiaceae bacterium]
MLSSFLDEAGWYAVGILGLLLMVSLGTGLYLWWPRWGKVRKALTIKRGVGLARLNFDLHRVTGSYFAAVLLILAFSGIYFVYPEYVAVLLRPFMSVTQGPVDLTSAPFPNPAPIPLSRGVAVALERFPNAELVQLNTPEGPSGVYEVRVHQPDEKSKPHLSSGVWVDQYNGAVLAVLDGKALTFGDTFVDLLWRLHSGEALGLPGRVLVCLTGFVPLVLYTTGIMQWLHRRRVRLG